MSNGNEDKIKELLELSRQSKLKKKDETEIDSGSEGGISSGEAIESELLKSEDSTEETQVVAVRTFFSPI